ncbi:hypothetical protein H632_c3150p0 [Helicosporidium sp. ATCC 50920]|nr:hypothetical protein H632_c3150p0 [Helicosporidium sp. ATCC 50920]|eukprot:KDD72592.1 hypothetical protein H632_c3150p0 [Helicosporidium sp. ATCC 50920]
MIWSIKNLRPEPKGGLYVLHVLPDMFASPAAGPAYFGDAADPLVEDALLREAWANLEDVFVSKGRQMGVEVTPVLIKESETKHVGSALVKKAEELEACPLVLAKHTKPNWQQVLLGSTSKFCALNCHRPVLLLHPGEFLKEVDEDDYQAMEDVVQQ